jgi:signal transduction histidine kinase
MREVYWISTKARRLLVVLAAIVAYIALLNIDITHTFHQLPLLWLHFGFSAPVALSFLAIGSLVWLYGSDRRVALPLFCFSCAMMVSFALETAAVSDDPLLRAVADTSAALAMACCAWLLLLFPRNYLQFKLLSLAHGKQRERIQQCTLLPYGYLALVVLLCDVSVAYFIINYLWGTAPPWLNSLSLIYDIVVLLGILATIIISYCKASSLRERQQLRILMGGVIVANIPLLLLTALPSALGLPSTYVVDGELSSLTMGLFPFALGFSILRYQILVFDTYIRRAVAWAVGAVCLAVLAYFIIVLCSTVFAGNISMYVVCIAIIAVVVAPWVWWLARTLTERLFFSEILHYRRLVERPSLLIDEMLDLVEASRLIELAVLHAFETQQACLFVLDESAECYRLCPELGEAAGDVQRRCLLDTLHTLLDPEEFESENCLDMQSSLVERLAAARRPLLSHEALRTGEGAPVGLSRYLTTEPYRHKMLLAPVRAQGKMIGVLVIGERGDRQHYAGSDFEIVQLILSRFSSVLETARLYARASQENARITHELRAAYERQQELDRLKDQFIVMASHELRTPLTAVQGYIELLNEYNTTLPLDTRAEFIAKARRGCDELTLLVGNIMDASRIHIDTENIRLRPVALADTVSHVVEILEAIIKREQRSIALTIPSAIQVMADDMRLRQIMLNLVSNALKYSPSGTDLEVGVRGKDGQVTIYVRDYGPGVAPADQQRLFERFVRLERDMNSPVRGAGLGLYVCKQLVEAMGGRIWVESSGIVDEGSIFAFTLRAAAWNREVSDLEERASMPS